MQLARPSLHRAGLARRQHPAGLGAWLIGASCTAGTWLGQAREDATGAKLADGRGGVAGAGWSHSFVASPPLWKPKRASPAAPGVKPLRLQPFGRAPAGAGFGAALGALPNRALCD